MERLTDEELREAFAVAASMNSMRLIAACTELRERRAADLSADEVEALRLLRANVDAEWPWKGAALAVLDKLLGKAG